MLEWLMFEYVRMIGSADAAKLRVLTTTTVLSRTCHFHSDHGSSIPSNDLSESEMFWLSFKNINLTMRQTLAGTHWHRVEPPFAIFFSFGQLSVLCWAILLRLFRLNLRTPGDQEMATLKSPICSRLVLSPPIHDKYVSIRHMEVIDDDSRWLTRKLLHAWYSVMVQLSQ